MSGSWKLCRWMSIEYCYIIRQLQDSLHSGSKFAICLHFTFWAHWEWFKRSFAIFTQYSLKSYPAGRLISTLFTVLLVETSSNHWMNYHNGMSQSHAAHKSITHHFFPILLCIYRALQPKKPRRPPTTGPKPHQLKTPNPKTQSKTPTQKPHTPKHNKWVKIRKKYKE